MTRSALPSTVLTLPRPSAPRCRGGASTLLRVARTPLTRGAGRWAAWYAAQPGVAAGDPQPGFITPLQPSGAGLAAHAA